MSIIRVRKDARYFSASNEPFNDDRISWETRGLMGYLLSKPDQWTIRIEDLLKKGPAGEYKIRRMLAEARMFGYMNRIRITKDDTTFDWITEMYESPALNPNPSKDIQKVQASSRFPTRGAPTRGKPRHILSTDGLSTEERDSGDAKIFQALSEMTGGGLNSNTPKFVDAWKERHTEEWILRAIGIAREKKIRSVKYVDEILVGWEANGYPKTREERVQERRANGKNSNGKSSKGWGDPKTLYPDRTPEQLEAAREEMRKALMGG